MFVVLMFSYLFVVKNVLDTDYRVAITGPVFIYLLEGALL